LLDQFTDFEQKQIASTLKELEQKQIASTLKELMGKHEQ
jgi:hypothetical protein